MDKPPYIQPIVPPTPPSMAPSPRPRWSRVGDFASGLVGTLLFNGAVVVLIILLMGSINLDFWPALLGLFGMGAVNLIGMGVASHFGRPFIRTGILTIFIISAVLLFFPMYAWWSCQHM